MIEAADCGGRITSKRGKDKTVARYFLMSQNYRPKDVMRIVRTHWTIENGLHWPLDVVLDEDLARNRKDNAPDDEHQSGRVKKPLLTNPASTCPSDVGALPFRRAQAFF